MLFDDWQSIARTIAFGAVAYGALIVFIRLFGKRTLAKLNAFDLIVTVALGSTLATVLLSKDVALVDGILAFAVLIGLQFAIAWTSVRSEAFEGLVKSAPRLLFYEGRFLDRDLLEERVTREEILAALRNNGVASIEDAGAVVLETDGTLTVIGRGSGTPDVLASVSNWPAPT
jgi:uncharacterized membrane protein YcaP (DUF421 family)